MELKWFKHYVTATKGESLNLIFDQHGHLGIAVYFMLLEELCARLSLDNPDFTVRVHQRELAKSCRLSQQKLHKLLASFEQVSLITQTLHKKVYEIKCPKILEILDKDSKYNRKRIVQQSPKIKELDKEAENCDPPGHRASPSAPVQQLVLASEKGITKKNTGIPAKQEVKANVVIGAWYDLYKEKYNVRYEFTKTEIGMLSKWSKGRSFQKIKSFFMVYLQIDSDYYQREKHPLRVFFRDFAKINHATQSGENPDSKVVDIGKMLSEEI